MAILDTITIPSKAPRNSLALAAKMRRGGYMKHKAAGRGGNRNDQRDLLAEAEADMEEIEVSIAEPTVVEA